MSPTVTPRTRTRQALPVLTLIGACALLAGCGKLLGSGTDPAQACAAGDTAAEIKKIVVDNDDYLHAVRPELMAKVGLRIDLPTLSAFDKTTKKISCEGSFVVQGPKSTDSVRGAYTIQPSADGKGLVYWLDGQAGQQLSGLFFRAVIAEKQAEAPPAAPAEIPADGAQSTAADQPPSTDNASPPESDTTPPPPVSSTQSQ